MHESKDWGRRRTGLVLGTVAVALSIASQASAQTVTAVEPVPATAPEPATPIPAPPVAVQTAPVPNSEPDVIVVEARRRAVAGDPLEAINAKSFAATQAVDRAVVGPVASGYKRAVPAPIRAGLRNVLKNLREPVVFLNYLLQFKPGKAAETVGRFAINSTIGVAGLFDMARRKPFNLPLRPNGFSDTLGYYGVKSGPFFFLPLLGPTTLRDLVGGSVDGLVLPTLVGKPFNKASFTIPTGIFNALDHRVQFDEELHIIRDESPDPYSAARDYYLGRRNAEIDALHSARYRERKRKIAPVVAPVVPTPPVVVPPPPPVLDTPPPR